MKEKILLCEICRREFKNYKALSIHLKKAHKITSKKYYDKFLKKEDEGICPMCRKETSFINLRKGYRKFCSYKCANEGVNNPSYGRHFSEETRKKCLMQRKAKLVLCAAGIIQKKQKRKCLMRMKENILQKKRRKKYLM